jgi:membrane protein implicated in regulation of membrane protease activity
VTGLYLFAAAAGVPLVAWFLLSGSEEGGDDAGGDDGIGGLMLRLFPLSTLAIVAATFGVCGLALGAVDTAGGTTFVGALVAAAIAGVLNSTVFAYLRRSDSTSSVGDAQLAGAVGRGVIPVVGEHPGRIAVSAGGQQIYLSARALPDADTDTDLEVGATVLVVEVRDGTATVVRLDPELT